MRNFALIILLTLIATLAFGAGVLRASAAEADFEERHTELFLPETREQYLPLSNASDAAFSDAHIAVSDANLLYIFDRAAGEYSLYEHFSAAGDTCNILKIQFAPDGSLFFSDQHTRLYRYDFRNGKAELLNDIPCATFFISGEKLYCATVASSGTTIYALPYENPLFSLAEQIGEITFSSAPRMFTEGDTLYCAMDNLVHTFVPAEKGGYEYTQQLLAGAKPVTGLSAVCIFEDEIYYSVNGASAERNGIYRAALGEDSTLVYQANGIRALTAFGDKLYVTTSSVREMQPDENGDLVMTGYEIAKNSSSYNRLSDAQDTAHGGDLLVIADVGNERVLVCNTKEMSFTALPCGAAQAVATDGNLIAAAVDDKVLLFRNGETQPYYTHKAQANVVGLTVVLGKCYYVTAISFGEAADGSRECERASFPAALSSDSFGNLYVAYAQGQVVRFHEEKFTDALSNGEELDLTLPVGYKSFHADYEGNVYCLYNGTIYQNGQPFAAAPQYFEGDKSCAFTFDVKDGGVYVQYGNYIVYESELAIPSLNTIPTENIRERVFSIPSSVEIVAISVPADIAGLQIDPSTLKITDEYFDCTGSMRTSGGNGVLLGKTQKYALCALFDNYTYKIYLIPADRYTEISFTREEPKTARQYTLSEVSLFGYPCLAEALTSERLPRSFAVTVLSILRFHDEQFDFAYVEAENGARGYLPLASLSESAPRESDPAGYTLGYLKANEDGVTFRTENGDTLVVRDRTRVKIYESDDGLYMVTFEKNGVTYSAQVTAAMIEKGNMNILRIGLIVILCVIAIGVLTGYALYFSKKKKNQ